MKFRFASMDFGVLLFCDLENMNNFMCELATKQMLAQLYCFAS